MLMEIERWKFVTFKGNCPDYSYLKINGGWLIMLTRQGIPLFISDPEHKYEPVPVEEGNQT
jgi:hypothetical protein